MLYTQIAVFLQQIALNPSNVAALLGAHWAVPTCTSALHIFVAVIAVTSVAAIFVNTMRMLLTAVGVFKTLIDVWKVNMSPYRDTTNTTNAWLITLC